MLFWQILPQKKNSNEIYSKINKNKVKIPVSDDLNKFINQNRYILIQESFFDNMRDGRNQIDVIRGEINDMYDLDNNNKNNISINNNKNYLSSRLKSS